MCANKGNVVFVPEGRNEGSQATYCLETCPPRPRPERDGVIGLINLHALSGAMNKSGTSDHTVPFRRRHPGYGGQVGTVPLFHAFQAMNCLASAPWNAHHRR